MNRTAVFWFGSIPGADAPFGLVNTCAKYKDRQSKILIGYPAGLGVSADILCFAPDAIMLL
jgi:hypothetical protein